MLGLLLKGYMYKKIFRPAAGRREEKSSTSAGSRVGTDDQHEKGTEGEETQKLEEAGVGSAVGLARSDLKLVGGSHRDRGPKGRVLGVSGHDRPGNTS